MDKNKNDENEKRSVPCSAYSGKLAGDLPCHECGWLYSEHLDNDVDYGDDQYEFEFEEES